MSDALRALREHAFVLPQYLLPQHFLTGLVYRITRCRRPFLRNLLIGRFIAVYDVDMSEAESPTPHAYEHFNAFFTRALRAGARPVDGAPDAVVSAADSAVSQAGRITGGDIIQAKGRSFTAAELLGSEEAAAPFRNGRFVTLYLSPRDYHRVHMPLDGQLEHIDYIPGRLFSVNAATTERVPRLFARNERIVCHFTTAKGPMVLCMVGALFVGSMETVSHGMITPARERVPRRLEPLPGAKRDFRKGEEFGRFNMGSTVILLFPDGAMEWSPHLAPGAKVKVGQRIGTLS